MQPRAKLRFMVTCGTMNTNKPSCLRSEDSERRDDRLHMVYWAYEMCCSGESINRPRLYDEFYQGVFSMIQLICYRNCSTCKKVIQLLHERGVAFEERQIDLERPTREELQRWHQLSGLPLKRFFNTSGMKYREMQLAQKLPQMTEDEQYTLLATDGMLVKRPILLNGDEVVVGADVTRWANERTT